MCIALLYIKGQGHEKWPWPFSDPQKLLRVSEKAKTLFGAESMYKYLQAHIEVLNWCMY